MGHGKRPGHSPAQAREGEEEGEGEKLEGRRKRRPGGSKGLVEGDEGPGLSRGGEGSRPGRRAGMKDSRGVKESQVLRMDFKLVSIGPACGRAA
jgi:hypothetical protein